MFCSVRHTAMPLQDMTVKQAGADLIRLPICGPVRPIDQVKKARMSGRLLPTLEIKQHHPQTYTVLAEIVIQQGFAITGKQL